MVPVEYVFEDDTCDNVVGQRCPKRDLKLKEGTEAAKAPRKDSARAKEGEPERGGVPPAARRRRGRPRKAERPLATGKEPQAGEQGTTGAVVEARVLQGIGDRTPTTRRGQPGNRGRRKQRDRGRNC